MSQPTAVIRPHLIAFVAIVVLGLLALSILPWWSLAAVGFAVGLSLYPVRAGSMFWPGMLAGMTVYATGIAVFSIGGGTLPNKIAELFGLGGGGALAAAVCVVGGLIAALPTLLGAYARVVVQGRPVV